MTQAIKYMVTINDDYRKGGVNLHHIQTNEALSKTCFIK